MRVTLCGILLLIAIAGCAGPPQNRSFPVTSDRAKAALEVMRHDPRPLSRPLVVVGGFLSPTVFISLFADHLCQITRDTTIIPVGIGGCGSFDECRQRIIDAVDSACPSADPDWTTEVDVIGLSLGGLASRYAACPPCPELSRRARDASHPRRLKIARLFTISSPHTGAILAKKISLIDFHRDMRPGSAFLAYVAQYDGERRYELYPYTHLEDETTGEEHAAPPGVNPYWLPNPPLISAHLAAMLDDRILADIARRLRGEEPFTHPPAQPLPQESHHPWGSPVSIDGRS